MLRNDVLPDHRVVAIFNAASVVASNSHLVIETILAAMFNLIVENWETGGVGVKR